MSGVEEESLEALRERADQLAPDDLEGAVVVYEAMLRLDAGDLLATRGLALALVHLGELDRAEEIVQESLILHAGDAILEKRAADIAGRRRWAAMQNTAAAGKRQSSVSRGPSTWIKAVHYDGGGWTEEPGSERWFSDPGQRDANGKRLYTAAGDPWGRPSWKVGEQAGIYYGGTHRVPLLVEIIRPPEFNPSFVQGADWAREGAGERWPWVTWVRVLRSVEVEKAPTLDELGIATSSMQQRARLHTNPDIHNRLLQALTQVS